MKMVTHLFTDAGRTWRQAAKVNSKGSMLYKALMEEMNGPLGQAMAVQIQRNAQYIRSVPADIAREMTEHVMSKSMAGLRYTDIAKDLKELYPHISDVKANLIARTETAKTATALTQSRSEMLGIQWYEWRTSEDDRVRKSHRHMDHVLVTWDDPPSPEELVHEKDVGHYAPGGIWNCLTGDTRVSSLVEYEKLYRRRYSGEIMEIFSTSLEPLIRVTPNHPILTNKGWIAAQDIDIGDYVFEVRDKQVDTFETHPHDVVPRFDELFGFLSIFLNIQRLPSTMEDFHGDASVDNQVDVIDIEWHLRNHVKPKLTQRDIEIIFSDADEFLERSFGFGTCDGTFLQFFPTWRSAPQSIVSPLDKAFSFFWSCFSHPSVHSFASIPWLDAVADKMFIDGSARNLELLCEGFDAMARQEKFYHLLLWEIFGVVSRTVMLNDIIPTSTEIGREIIRMDIQRLSDFMKIHSVDVQPVRVLNKVRREFSDHVYNLQNSKSWYISNGIITHNCRCYAAPVIDLDTLDWPHKVYFGGQIQRMSRKQFEKVWRPNIAM